jgi:hypothetical protein
VKRFKAEPRPERTEHLSQHQFIHVAPQSARSNIEKYGIDHTQGGPTWEQKESGDANFLWTHQKDAYTYRKGVNALSKTDGALNWLDNSGKNYDVYEVNIPKINRPKLENDPEFDTGLAVRTTQPIPRRFVRRIG